MPTDPKWRVVAKRSGRPLSEVLAVFTVMLTSASQTGSLDGWDDEVVAAALDSDAEHVAAIRQAMQGKTLDGLQLTGWEKRQPKREDNSAERVKRFRERKRLESNETVDPVTQCNAPVTQANAPDTDTDTDTEKEPPKVPQGDDDGNAVAQPIDLRTAFLPADENEGVIYTEAGTVRLVNGTRTFWLNQFGGNEQRLDLALRQVSIQPQSRIPIRSQVDRQLARIAGDKLDRDERYQAAVAANKPSLQGSRSVAEPTGRTMPSLSEALAKIVAEEAAHAAG
jgi:hypothetical protein